MVDTPVLGTGEATRVGSSPISPTKCSYSLVVEHIHGKDTAQVRFLVGAPQGRMPKLVDGHGSGPCVARRESSSLSSPTTKH